MYCRDLRGTEKSMRKRKEENKCSNTNTKLTLRKSTDTIKILKSYPGITDLGRRHKNMESKVATFSLAFKNDGDMSKGHRL